jgi:hypothetical protein
VEENRSKFPTDDSEIKQRKEFVVETRKRVLHTKEEMNDLKADVASSAKQTLMAGTAGESVFISADERYDDMVSKDNDEFIVSESQRLDVWNIYTPQSYLPAQQRAVSPLQ